MLGEGRGGGIAGGGTFVLLVREGFMLILYLAGKFNKVV